MGCRDQRSIRWRVEIVGEKKKFHFFVKIKSKMFNLRDAGCVLCTRLIDLKLKQNLTLLDKSFFGKFRSSFKKKKKKKKRST